MSHSIKQLYLSILLLIITVIPVSAQTINLTWDQNTEPEVTGYRVYYRTNSPTFPFNGTSLAEGASPIVVEGADNTSLALDLPQDGNIYYFTATALTADGLESRFSEIIASEWVPNLISPPDRATTDTSVTLTWDLPPTGFNVTYDLLYGTDPNLDINAMAATGPGTFKPGREQVSLSLAALLAALLCLFTAIRTGSPKHAWPPLRAGLCMGIFVLQASCGGGGGSEITAQGTSPDAPEVPLPSSAVASSPAPATPTPLFTDVITDIKGTEYQVTELQPGTQYYWKVVAIDNWGAPFESLTQTFTTSRIQETGFVQQEG